MEQLKTLVYIVGFLIAALALYGAFKVVTGIMSWFGVCIGAC